ncbi:MAG: hypothetical protein UV16_C0001G0102 [candidate division WWE3 bacterium GW2011_GWE2_42_25]|uniref:Uncharacterized protein n=1 Tax=candidate division WWE3 bacterium GW2011_GWC2_41_23 TaxID=1619123 RepID=A0A0G0YSM3_UNCKA|nr:MAG: hypothetical protein UU55_C0002G0008 [candidate division WWE3 bacterium GW2011_GWC2_41_23]KKS28501.1 MAG: hypothetical protein UU86_C0001G0021 [candidate division WWE3 bacterium GW2011_GWC1_42_102]KKS51383.1 MAG: hypothetical protein UV16_C0001G0102 [candidate division WWE3 bacterium GW2011_GWE2_42_25]
MGDTNRFDAVPDVCPNCHRHLSGTLLIEQVRYHLDGHCIRKSTYVRQQQIRKENPKLPGM